MTRAALIAAALLLVGVALGWARPAAVASVAAAIPPVLGVTVPLDDTTAEAVVVLNDDNFAAQVETAQGLVLVDFFATWCGPCRAMKPNFDKVAADYKDRLKFGALDIDVGTKTAKKYDIEAVPTLIVFKDGKQVAQHVGYCGPDDIKAIVDAYLK
jgi:thioredoxin 1